MKIDVNMTVHTGNVVEKPELMLTTDGVPVASFSIAVHSKRGEPDFFRLVTWRNDAEFCAKHLEKGDLVYVKGSLQNRKYEKNGKKMTSPEIVVKEIKILNTYRPRRDAMKESIAELEEI